MLKRYYVLIFFAFLTLGCAQKKEKPLIPELHYSHTCTKQVRYVKSFNQIDVKGRINVDIHTGYKQPQVILTGDPRDLEEVKVVVTYTTLHVLLSNGYPQHGAVHVEIRGRFLNDIHYEGAGIIKGTQLSSRYLNLNINNTGTTQLGGTLGLHDVIISGTGVTQLTGVSSPWLNLCLNGNPKVQMQGTVNLAGLKMDGGWLSLYWIKGYNLKIRARQGSKLQLAGVINRLDVELWGNAQFKGRYLRAQRSFVKTHDRSLAEISATNHQSTLATDASDIYYYNISTTRADFMAYNGAVLDMREWSPYDYQDFDRYNKQFP